MDFALALDRSFPDDQRAFFDRYGFGFLRALRSSEPAGILVDWQPGGARGMAPESDSDEFAVVHISVSTAYRSTSACAAARRRD